MRRMQAKQKAAAEIWGKHTQILLEVSFFDSVAEETYTYIFT
jgi:hypothetical protein